MPQQDTLSMLGEAIGLPTAFNLWCHRHQVDSMPAFLHVEISEDGEGQRRLWYLLQATLRQARAVAESGSHDTAVTLVARLLELPEYGGGRGDARARAMRLVAPLSTPRRSQTNARQELVRAGGVASARYLADRLSASNGVQVSVRQVRDRLRHTRGGVRKIGAGYYAVGDRHLVSVGDWVEAVVDSRGPLPIDALADAILERYPHGHRHAVLAWLHQDPGRLWTQDGVVHLAGQALSA